MIVLERKAPIIIEQNKAILRRLPESHPSWQLVNSNQRRRLAGLRGEQALDYHLKLLNEDETRIFHNLRLNYHSQFFEMDTLIITPCFALIIQIKNFKGSLHFESKFNQMIRTLDNKQEGYHNPVIQVNRHKELLTGWLKDRHIKNIPILTLVVISHVETILSSDSQEFNTDIIHADHFLATFKKYQEHHSKKILPTKSLNKLTHKILQEHTPLKANNILQYYNIVPDELTKGVLCPICEHVQMIRIHGNWVCAICNTHSKDAYRQAFLDYFLLISPMITNKGCRIFLDIESRHLAKKMLLSMNLHVIGIGKGTFYYQYLSY